MPDPTVSHESELLTITEAAELLRAPVATLRYWRHLGTGPRSFRLGRRVVYRRADLHGWIDSSAPTRPTADEPPGPLCDEAVELAVDHGSPTGTVTGQPERCR
jgi:predicted DNA-binding transcriptional regulator AlpA